VLGAGVCAGGVCPRGITIGGASLPFLPPRSPFSTLLGGHDTSVGGQFVLSLAALASTPSHVIGLRVGVAVVRPGGTGRRQSDDGCEDRGHEEPSHGDSGHGSTHNVVHRGDSLEATLLTAISWRIARLLPSGHGDAPPRNA
jgi:hypothetical protein